MKKFRDMYGASPLHFLAVVASFAIVGYALYMIFQTSTAIGFVIWFVAAIFAHDMVAFPLYSLLNLIANRSVGGRAGYWVRERDVQPLNYIRIPLVLSAFAFLLFFPDILGLNSERYFNDTGVSGDVFLGRWIGICAALFTISALAYAVNLRRAGGQRRAEVAARAAKD